MSTLNQKNTASLLRNQWSKLLISASAAADDCCSAWFDAVGTRLTFRRHESALMIESRQFTSAPRVLVSESLSVQRRRSVWSARFLFVSALVILQICVSAIVTAQPRRLTWQEVRDRFEAHNSSLLADTVNVDESRAEEITAYLRPNPTLTLSADGTQIAPTKGAWQPLAGTFESPTISYLHERRNKRELRLQSAKKGTLIAQSSMPTWNGLCCSTCAARLCPPCKPRQCSSWLKTIWRITTTCWRSAATAFKAGDIAQIDLDRLELQRVQYESDVQTADVNLRTAKIQMLTLLNDRRRLSSSMSPACLISAINLTPLDEFRKIALDTRPDLKAAIQTVDKAQTDHKLAVANGSTDPTFSVWYTQNGSFNNPLAQYSGRERQRSAPHLRSQPGRETAHQDRHHAQRKVAGCRRGPGLQRCGFRLTPPWSSNLILLRPYKAEISGAGRACAGHNFIFLSARRSFAAGFSQRGEVSTAACN